MKTAIPLPHEFESMKTPRFLKFINSLHSILPHTIRNIIVVRCNNESEFAVATTLIGSNTITEPFYLIHFRRDFVKNHSQDVILAVLAHEIGHICLGHLGMSDNKNYSKELEIAATQHGIKLASGLGDPSDFLFTILVESVIYQLQKMKTAIERMD